jgi:hypothetical protein
MVAGESQATDAMERFVRRVAPGRDDLRRDNASSVEAPDEHAGDDELHRDLAVGCGDHRPDRNAFVDRIVRVFGHAFGIALHRPPGVRDVAIHIIERFDTWRMRPGQEEGRAVGEGLDDVGAVAEAGPDEISHAGLPSEGGPGGFELLSRPESMIDIDTAVAGGGAAGEEWSAIGVRAITHGLPPAGSSVTS